jgi:hypothetical protein
MLSSQVVEGKMVVSEVQQNTNLPYWALIKGSIVFRGTYHELRAEDIYLTLR